MKIERLSQDKIRIFLTFDDLHERGIQKDDLWREIPKVHELFSEMMEQAYMELGFDATGPLAVEVFAMPAQGMVVIVTKGNFHTFHKLDDDDELEDDVYEMEVTLEHIETISYAFQDFEDVISAAKLLQGYVQEGGALYMYKERWVLQIEPSALEESNYQTVISILSEFGEATSITSAVLGEYGKLVMTDNAIQVICSHF